MVRPFREVFPVKLTAPVWVFATDKLSFVPDETGEPELNQAGLLTNVPLADTAPAALLAAAVPEPSLKL